MRLNEITGIDKNKIEAVLKQYGIKNYTIRDDGNVDVSGRVDLSKQTFTKLPVKFGKVTGNFICDDCRNLESLQGAPKSITGNFSCHGCVNLVSLQGVPKSIDGEFDCSVCHKLESLEGAPESVGKGFYCISCINLTSLKGAPKSVTGNFYCGSCSKLKVILPILKTKHINKFMVGHSEIDDIINKYLHNGDILGCQEELIEAGFEEYARIK